VVSTASGLTLSSACDPAGLKIKNKQHISEATMGRIGTAPWAALSIVSMENVFILNLFAIARIKKSRPDNNANGKNPKLLLNMEPPELEHHAPYEGGAS